MLALSTNRAIDVLSPEEDADDSLLEPVTIEGTIESRGKNTLETAPSPWRNGWRIALAYFCLLLLFGVRLVYAQQVYKPAKFDARDLVTVDAEALPAEIDGWKVIGFDQKIRPLDSALAPSSFLWRLQKGNQKCIVSLDGPYQEYHDLCDCYRGIGWKLLADYNVANKDPTQSWATLTALNMEKRSKHGLVIFSAFDSKGQPVSNRVSLTKRGNIMRNMRMVIGQYHRDMEQPATLPISQVQILYERQSEISESETEELMQLFYGASELLLNSRRFTQLE